MLNTARLQLNLASHGDATALSRYYSDNWDHLSPWEPRRRQDPRETIYWQRQLLGQEAEQANGSSLMLLLRHHDREAIIGTIRFSQIFRGGFQSCSLGFGLGASAIGQGLMQEALTTAIAHMFDDLELHRIAANYLPRNRRSGRLLQHLGFAIEGTARDYLQINGNWEDHVLTAKLNKHLAPAIV